MSLAEYQREVVAAEERDFDTARDALLYVIDASASMLAPCEKLKGRNCVQVALESALDAITKKVTASPLDMAGVILYGTKGCSDQEFPNCTIVNELGMPDSARLKHLKRMVSDDDEFRKVTDSPSEALLSNVFFLCMRQFEQNCKVKSAKRIVFITDNDAPHKQDAQKRLSAKTRASDLVEKSIFIEPVFIANNDFDTSIYYDELPLGVNPYDEEDGEVNDDLFAPKPVDALNLGSSIINSRHLKRPSCTVDIELPTGMRIGAKAYLLYKKRDVVAQKKKVYTDAETPQLVKIKSRAIVEATGREFELKDLKRSFTFGGKTVNFSPDRLHDLKYFGSPIVRIIGFKPATAIKDWMNISHSTMLYPSENRFEGSIRAFSTLFQALANKSKVAIAWCIMRKNDAPRLFALMPSPGPYHKEVPQGLQMVPLPFADDIRKKPTKMYLEPPSELVSLAKDIMHTLTMPKGYEPERYANPSLAWSFQVLESLALDEELGDPQKDATLPKFKSMRTRAGSIISNWNELLDKIAPYVPDSEPEPPKKRSADAVSAEKPKKQKLGTSLDDFVRANEDGLLATYSVKDLRDFAKDQGLKNIGSSKDIMIANISAYLNR